MTMEMANVALGVLFLAFVTGLGLGFGLWAAGEISLRLTGKGRSFIIVYGTQKTEGAE